MRITGTKMSKTSIRRSDYLLWRALELENLKQLLSLTKTFSENKNIVKLATEGAERCGKMARHYKTKAEQHD